MTIVFSVLPLTVYVIMNPQALTHTLSHFLLNYVVCPLSLSKFLAESWSELWS